MADSFGRKPVVLAVRWCLPPPRWRVRWQTPSIADCDAFLPRAGCGCGQRGHYALMRDIYPKEEFSRMMSFVSW